MADRIPNTRWRDTEITPWVLEAVENMGFKKMTPVQAATIPLLSGNKDVVVEAVTGSGKTLAFLIPVLEKVLRVKDSTKPGSILAIIVTPTRELAEQINSVLQLLLEFQPLEQVEEKTSSNLTKVTSQLVIGGSSTALADVQDFRQLRPQILIGTPGRLYDVMRSTSVITSSLEILILDEADRLLDLGFDTTVDDLLSMLPKQRRSGLFSATISDAVDDLVRARLRYPVKVMVKVGQGKDESKVPTTLKNSYALVSATQKAPMLLTLLGYSEYRKCIVYYPTCASVSYGYNLLNELVKRFLSHNEIMPKIYSIHGKLSLKARSKALKLFSSTMEKSVLLATDVAARGLDIPEVDLVVQLDPPTDTKVFLHRAGRTGRAGRAGRSVIFLTPGREEGYVDIMQVRKVLLEPLISEQAKFRGSIDLGDPEATERICQALREMAEMFIKTTSGSEISTIKVIKAAQKWVMKDRSRHDEALRSYVSFIKFYSKHLESSIFRVGKLDFVRLGLALGLVRLPRMPEIRDNLNESPLINGYLGYNQENKNDERFRDLCKAIDIGELLPVVDMDEFSYQDASKEKSRQEELSKKLKQKCFGANAAAAGKEYSSKSSKAWSKQDEKADKREERRDKRKAKHDFLHNKDAKPDEKNDDAAAAASDSDSDELQQDWKEMVTRRKKHKQTGIDGTFDGL